MQAPAPRSSTPATKRSRLFGQPYLLLTLTTLMWAGNAIASRLAVGEISPMALTTLRWVIAAVLMGFVAVDEAVSPELLARIESIPQVKRARAVRF